MENMSRTQLRKMVASIQKAARAAVRQGLSLELFLAQYGAEWQASAAHTYNQEVAYQAAVAAGKYQPSELAGRCVDGAQRDSGHITHAVPEGFSRAYCGAKPGRKSVGWTMRVGTAVNCPGCLRKI